MHHRAAVKHFKTAFIHPHLIPENYTITFTFCQYPNEKSMEKPRTRAAYGKYARTTAHSSISASKDLAAFAGLVEGSWIAGSKVTDSW